MRRQGAWPAWHDEQERAPARCWDRLFARRRCRRAARGPGRTESARFALSRALVGLADDEEDEIDFRREIACRSHAAGFGTDTKKLIKLVENVGSVL